MFDHLGLPVTALEQARRFHEQAPGPLGIGVVKTRPGAVGLAAGRGGKDAQEPWLVPAGHAPSPLHLAFAAADRAQVDAFHRAALAVGARGNGPDGHNLEAVCHLPQDTSP